MIHPPSNSPSLIKRVLRRLGLDFRQNAYFFYMPNTKSAQGSLIALAAVFMVVVAILIPVAMTLVRNVRSNTAQAQLNVAGAQNAAKAGLEDALGYFIRQGTVLTAYTNSVTMGATPTYATGVSYVDQPFNPIYNTSNAQYSDTFQGTTVNLAGGITHAFYGLCNEYPVDAASNSFVAAGQTTSVYFGRYEVQEQPNPIATAGVTFTPNPLAVHDISGTRQANYVNGDGLVWAITSTGYIYKRMDYTMDSFGEYNVPYNVYPNKVLATAKAYTEFRKLSCTLPNSGSVSTAAVYCSAATNVSLTNYCYMGGVVASGYGLCAMSGSVTKPTGATSNNFFGGGVTMNSTNGPISDVNIFGMSLKDIQFIADYVGSASIPLSITTANKLSYFNGDLTYAATQSTAVYQQLNSSGILIVNGNLTLGKGGLNSASSVVGPSYYSGIVFVTGNMTISDGSQVDGVVVMGYSTAYSGGGANKLTLLGSAGGNFAKLTNDPAGVTAEVQRVAQYREDISARRVLLAFPGI